MFTTDHCCTFRTATLASTDLPSAFCDWLPIAAEAFLNALIRPLLWLQYYFETLFPRIPKPVHDTFVSKLTSMGLPSKAVGNGGQGGADRRGIEEPNRRPASVKASL